MNTPKLPPVPSFSTDLIDLPNAPDAVAPQLDAIRASQAEIERLVQAAIATHTASLKAEAQAAIDYAKATADKMLAAMGSQKAKVVGIKINDQEPIILSGKRRPHAMLADVITRIKAGFDNIALTGPRGSGKTTLASQVAEGLTVPFGMMVLTEGMSRADIYGSFNEKGEWFASPFWEMMDKPGVFLLDEGDAGCKNTWLNFNAVLSNKSMFNPKLGVTKVRHPDFVILTAMNTNGRGGTVEYSARSSLDQSTLDRFHFRRVDYDRELEAELCPFPEMLARIHAARDRLTDARAKETLGTRSVQTAARMLSFGFSEAETCTQLTEGWDENAKRIAAI